MIETAVGLTRTVLAVLADAYDEDEVEGEKRTVMRFHPAIAPVTVAVFPLLKKDGLAELAREVAADLRADMTPSTTRAAPSAGATAARTRSARRTASRSTTRAGTTER